MTRESAASLVPAPTSLEPGRATVGRVRALLAPLALAVALTIPTPGVRAQDESSGTAPEQAEAERRPEQLDPARPIVLRPEAALQALAERVARVLSLRAQVEVTVGPPPPGGIVDAVLEGEGGLAREEAEVAIVLGGPVGLSYASRIDLPASRDAAVRALALAIEALRDSALEGPPPERVERMEGNRHERVSYVYVEPEGGIFGVRVSQGPLARPTIFVRLLVGFSTARDTVLIGPGAGVGLCLGLSCIILDADLPLIPDARAANDGTVVQYRALTMSMRGSFRFDEWVFGDGQFFPGFSVGVLMRFGNAWIEETGANQIATSFGFRGTLELAWRFAAPFEWVVELGADLAVNPVSFIRAGEDVLLEDVGTLWGVTSVRLRP